MLRDHLCSRSAPIHPALTDSKRALHSDRTWAELLETLIQTPESVAAALDQSSASVNITAAPNNPLSQYIPISAKSDNEEQLRLSIDVVDLDIHFEAIELAIGNWMRQNKPTEPLGALFSCLLQSFVWTFQYNHVSQSSFKTKGIFRLNVR